MTVGARFARAAYSAAVRPAGPEPRIKTRCVRGAVIGRDYSGLDKTRATSGISGISRHHSGLAIASALLTGGARVVVTNCCALCDPIGSFLKRGAIRWTEDLLCWPCWFCSDHP